MRIAVQTHHLYHLKFIVDGLHEMEFCISYTEVLRFENKMHQILWNLTGSDTDLLEMSDPHPADNIEHTIITIKNIPWQGVIISDTPGRH